MDFSDRRSTVSWFYWRSVIPKTAGRRQRESGSVLVMVLWLLVLISFLAGQYLAHNREKADIAQNAWTAFRQKQAVSSVVQLFSTDAWPVPDGTGADGHWFRLFPDDMQVWTRVDKESQRINLNTAADGEIKQKLSLMMGDDFLREADAVSDCILDWRDTDSLTRMQGAEEKDYQTRGLSYRPANGPFNVMSELLLVMGVTPDMFWANPLELIATDLGRFYIQPGTEAQTRVPKALSEGFTIYAGENRRISLLVPGSETGYLYMNVIMAKESGRLAVVDSLQFMGVSEAGFDRLAELESETRGLGATGNKRL